MGGDFFILCLGSSSALISATWFANIFDVSCLLLISIGLLLALQGHSAWSGVAIGLSFYCKEIAIIAFPFFLILYISQKISVKELSKSYFVATILAATYALARQQLVDIGSANDIHQFDSKELTKSTLIFIQSFWWEHTKFESGSIQANTGIAFFCLSLLAAKDGRIRIICTTIVLLSSLAYWGMVSYQNEDVISSLNFIGRLYLVPTILILFLLTLNKKRGILILLCPPILGGTFLTYKDHLQFQNLYQSIYEIAAKTEGVFTVHFPEKQLNYSERNLRIEKNPNAPYSIDIINAKLIPN